MAKVWNKKIFEHIRTQADAASLKLAEEKGACPDMEEIGVKIEIIRFTGRYYDKPGRHPTKTAISLPFRTRIILGKPHPAQPEEVADVRWFTPEEIRKMELAFDHKQMLEDEGLI